MQIEPNWFADELMRTLGADIATGNASIDSNWEPVSEAICHNFPFVGSGIDWGKVPGAKVFSNLATASSQSSRELKEPAVELKRSWTSVQSENRIDSNLVVTIFGDSHFDFVIRMPIWNFTKHIVDFFSIPHNTYVVPKDYSWCLNYTFGDRLYFGKRQ